MIESRRIATWVAFAHVLEATAQDDVLDLLELLVKDLLSKSERDGKRACLRTLKDLGTAALQLSQACGILLDPNCEPSQMRSAVFVQVSEDKLAAAIAQVETLARPADDAYYCQTFARRGLGSTPSAGMSYFKPGSIASKRDGATGATT
jgi:hypothetical protein